MPLALMVHGGAGPRRGDENPAALRAGCLAAARAGHACLREGKSALDAVEAAVRVLEDDPLFNAGRGACLTFDGEVELDASVMDGQGRRAGAVALVRTVRHPVSLARAVMEKTPHVFIAGEGAEALAGDAGLERVDPAWFVTPAARSRWEAAKRAMAAPGPSGGTVGAVALDARGHVAAATSTGGMLLKRRGRIGDSPIIGAGCWADDQAGAASATGQGEVILRATLCRVAADLLASGCPAQQAAERALDEVRRLSGEAGLILVSPQGALGAAFNTGRMAHAFVDAEGREGSGFAPGA